VRNLFIGSTHRSGGSLLARLFDHHPDVAAYPFELHLPMDPALHPSLARRGDRSHVQDFPQLPDGMAPEEIARAIGLDRRRRRCLVGSHFRDGKLRAKSRHLDLDAEFDHARFLERFLAEVRTRKGLSGAYDALHEAFFREWDGGLHAGSLGFVAFHRANGLLADVERFLRDFEGSLFLQPVRRPEACIASEKRKALSQLASGRIVSGWRPSDRWLRRFGGRFAEDALVAWLVSMTRSVILKQRLGDRVLVYRHEDLVRDPETVMRRIADAVGLPFHEALLRPTNGGHPWAGNSMFGRQEGVAAERDDPAELLNETERELVERYAAPIVAHLARFEGRFVDYEDLDPAVLFDYEHQCRYAEDREKTALHFATLIERWPSRALSRSVLDALRRRPRPFYL
jgi:hypothetical protein